MIGVAAGLRGQLVHQLDSSTIHAQYCHLPPPFEDKLISVNFFFVLCAAVIVYNYQAVNRPANTDSTTASLLII